MKIQTLTKRAIEQAGIPANWCGVSTYAVKGLDDSTAAIVLTTGLKAIWDGKEEQLETALADLGLHIYSRNYGSIEIKAGN